MKTPFSTEQRCYPEKCILLTKGLPEAARPLTRTDHQALTALMGKQGLEGYHTFPISEVLDARSETWELEHFARAELLIKEQADEVCAADIFDTPPVFLAGEVTSTFTVGWELLRHGLLPEWGAVLALVQTEGRGQLRRNWHSPAGNLHVTFRLPDDPLFRDGPASLLTGCLISTALRRLGFPLQMKWPNDLLNSDSEKAGGILIEEKDGALLAGLGINLVSAPAAGQLRSESAWPAGLLVSPRFTEDGKTSLAPYALWRLLVDMAILEYRHSFAQRRPSDIIADPGQSFACLGERVVVLDADGSRLRGRFEALNPSGALVLSMDTGEKREIFSGSLFREG